MDLRAVAAAADADKLAVEGLLARNAWAAAVWAGAEGATFCR